MVFPLFGCSWSLSNVDGLRRKGLQLLSKLIFFIESCECRLKFSCREDLKCCQLYCHIPVAFFQLFMRQNLQLNFSYRIWF